MIKGDEEILEPIDYKKVCEINPRFPYIYVIYDIEQLKNIFLREKLTRILDSLKKHFEYVLWNCSYIYENYNADEIELIDKSVLIILFITKDSYKSTYIHENIKTIIKQDKEFLIYFLDDSKKEDLIQKNSFFQKIFFNQELIYGNCNDEAKLISSITKYHINFINISLNFRKEVKIFSYLNEHYKKELLMTILKKIPSNKRNHQLKNIQEFNDVIQVYRNYKFILIIPFFDFEFIQFLLYSFKNNPMIEITILFKYFKPQFKKNNFTTLTQIINDCDIDQLQRYIGYFTMYYPNIKFIGDVFFNHDHNDDRIFNYFYSNKDLMNLCEFKTEGKFLVQNNSIKLKNKMRKNFIFVSYSHKDRCVKSKIDYLKDGLKYNLIIDYDYFLMGDIWTFEVQKLISSEKCKAVLVFNSINYSSKSIEFEIREIIENKKTLLLISLDKTVNETINNYKNKKPQKIEELPQVFKEMRIAKNREEILEVIYELIMLIIILTLCCVIPFVTSYYFCIPKDLKLNWDILFYISTGAIIPLFSFISFLIPLNFNQNYQKYNLLFYSIQVIISIILFFLPNFHLKYLYMNYFLLYEGLLIIFANFIRIIRKKRIKSISIIHMLIFLLLLLILLICRFWH